MSVSQGVVTLMHYAVPPVTTSDKKSSGAKSIVLSNSQGHFGWSNFLITVVGETATVHSDHPLFHL